MKIKITALREGAAVPKYATAGSAACDLTNASGEAVTVAPAERKLIPTGIAIAPESAGVAALVCARSGLSTKHGLALANGIGVIDSDYRGEILVSMINHSDKPYTVAAGERIAQLLFVPVVQAEFELVDSLDETERGAGGFGSTGA